MAQRFPVTVLVALTGTTTRRHLNPTRYPQAAMSDFTTGLAKTCQSDCTNGGLPKGKPFDSSLTGRIVR